MWMAAYTEAKLRERQQVKLYRHFTWGRPKALRVALRGRSTSNRFR